MTQQNDVIGLGGCPCPNHATVVFDAEQLNTAELTRATDHFSEIMRGTTDRQLKHVFLRALGVYRAIVDHVRGGGTVKFLYPDGQERVLKVRVR